MEIRIVGAELFHADRQTDKTKLIVAFRNFANAPKNECEVSVNAQCTFNGKHFSRILSTCPSFATMTCITCKR
jgi:hypothetical protein